MFYIRIMSIKHDKIIEDIRFLFIVGATGPKEARNFILEAILKIEKMKPPKMHEFLFFSIKNRNFRKIFEKLEKKGENLGPRKNHCTHPVFIQSNCGRFEMRKVHECG